MVKCEPLKCFAEIYESKHLYKYLAEKHKKYVSIINAEIFLSFNYYVCMCGHINFEFIHSCKCNLYT